MKLGEIRGINIELNAALLIVAGIAAAMGKLPELLTVFFCLINHEMAHTVVARALGYTVERIEVQFFGGVARMRENNISVRDDCSIAAAGPLSSFLSAFGCIAFSTFIPAIEPAMKPFIQINMSLALVNLLPAYPLDGGRILRAILSLILKAKTATKVASVLGMLIAVLILGLGIYMIAIGLVNLSLITIGVFLFWAAIKEYRNASMMQLHTMLKKNYVLGRGDALPIKHIAVNLNMTITSALRTLVPGKYTLIDVVDDSMRHIDTLGEGELMEGLARYGSSATLGQISHSSRH